MALILLLAGLVLLALFAVAGRDPARRARKRRMGALKARHGSADLVETQLRRIAAQRATKMDDAFHRLLPRPELLRRRIETAGKSWTLGQYGMGCAGITLGAWVLLYAKGLPIALTFFVGVLLGIGLPYWWVGRLGKKRVRKFLVRFPDAIDLLVRGLRSGLPITETMQIVAGEVPDPVGSEFRGVADRMRIGRTMDEALQETADRLQTPEFQFFVITLAIQRETGGNLAETLGNLGDVLRKRLQMKLKINAMSSESKASAYIIGALPLIVFALIYFVNSEYMTKFFTDTRLIYVGCGGALWMCVGAFIMSRMIAFEV